MNETTATIVGNVISDLRQRRTADGTKVVSFRLASNERRYDRASEQWVDGDHLFVTVTCWRRLATGVAASLTKGDPVVVTGRLYTRGYEVDGQRRSTTEMEAVAVGPDLARCTAELQRHRADPGFTRTDTAAVPAQRRQPEVEAEEPLLPGSGGEAAAPEAA